MGVYGKSKLQTIDVEYKNCRLDK